MADKKRQSWWKPAPSAGTQPAGGAAGHARKTAATSVQMAYEKPQTPFYYYSTRGHYQEGTDDEALAEHRELARKYYRYHDLIPLIIDIYSRFPLRGMRIVAQNDDAQKAFDDQFIRDLDYRKFLIDVGREYFLTGEANVLATWDSKAGRYTSDQILNPDAVHVAPSPFAGPEKVTLDVSEHVYQAIEEATPRELEEIEAENPDLIAAAQAGRPVRLAPELIYRLVNRVTPWDTRGIPMISRAFDSLLREEKLYAAQDAVADRLYSPMVLVKLGIPANEAGTEYPVIPTEEEIEAFKQDLNSAMAADFRAMIYNFGIDIKSVFGRESMPKFDNDFDRLEKKILRAFGIGASLIDGSSQGAYASTAINRDFVSNMMADYQLLVQGLFAKRAELFARANGIWQIDTSDDNYGSILTETVEVEHEDGTVTIEERPVPHIPRLEFAAKPLGSAADELELLIKLRKEGVPISQEALISAAGDPVEPASERLRVSEEAINDKRREQETAAELARMAEEAAATGQTADLEDVAPETGQPRDNGGAETAPAVQSDTYRPSRELE